MTDRRTLLLDAEALHGLATMSPAMQTWARAALDADSPIAVSALTIAEVTDGSARDARVLRALKTLDVIPVDPDVARTAGRLRARATPRRKPRDLTVDAVVVATAAVTAGPVTILTSDPGDLTALATDLPRVRVRALS